MGNLATTYFDAIRQPNPDEGLAWSLTDRWWRQVNGWVAPQDLVRYEGGRPILPGDELYRYEFRFLSLGLAKHGPWLSAGTRFWFSRAGLTEAACSPAALRRLATSLWGVVVYYPDCPGAACYSEILLVERPQGIRVLNAG